MHVHTFTDLWSLIKLDRFPDGLFKNINSSSFKRYAGRLLKVALLKTALKHPLHDSLQSRINHFSLVQTLLKLLYPQSSVVVNALSCWEIRGIKVQESKVNHDNGLTQDGLCVLWYSVHIKLVPCTECVHEWILKWSQVVVHLQQQQSHVDHMTVMTWWSHVIPLMPQVHRAVGQESWCPRTALHCETQAKYEQFVDTQVVEPPLSKPFRSHTCTIKQG